MVPRGTHLGNLLSNRKLQEQNFVVRGWNVASAKSIPKHPTFGWKMSKNTCIIWFHALQMPDSNIPEIILDSDDVQEHEDNSSEEESNNIDMD